MSVEVNEIFTVCCRVYSYENSVGVQICHNMIQCMYIAYNIYWGSDRHFVSIDNLNQEDTDWDRIQYKPGERIR